MPPINVRPAAAGAAAGLPEHALVGCWHNFTNPSGCAIPIGQVSNDWDVIVVAFAENDPLSQLPAQHN
jgi:chitinase